MQARPHRLRLVEAPRERIELAARPARADVALLAALLGVNLVPIVGEVARVGRWGAGTVGFATACALLAARALWLELRTLLQARG